MNGLFVTGTNTGVGKTIICGAIGLACQEKGYKVCYFKPFESGCSALEGPGSDTGFVSRLLGLPGEPPFYNSYTFKHPLAPGVAAELEGVDVDIDLVRDRLKILSSQFDYVIVEGVGGLLVPLSRFPLEGKPEQSRPPVTLVSDLFAELDLPVLLVSSSGLGTINHTLLSWEYCKAKGIGIAGIVMNDDKETDRLTGKTNESVFRYYFGESYLGRFPKLPGQLCNGGLDPGSGDLKKHLLDAVRGNLDIGGLSFSLKGRE
jgi:dethiobiotin synthetase